MRSAARTVNTPCGVPDSAMAGVPLTYMPWIVWNPHYASLHGEPGFRALVERLKLPAGTEG